MAEECTALNRKGEGCRAYRMKDSPHCFLHRPEPEMKQRAALAQRNGALAQVITVGEVARDLSWPKRIHLRKPRDVRRFVSRILNELRAGKVEPQLANSMFVGCQVLLKTLDPALVDRTDNQNLSDDQKDAMRRIVAESLRVPP